MWGNAALDIILALLGCAALLGLIAAYTHFHDPGVIDEEEEIAVEEESPNERTRAREYLAERFGNESDKEQDTYQ